MLSRILSILKIEFVLTLRNTATLAALALFVFGASYVSYRCFQSLHTMGWIAMFWILYLFSVINLALPTYQHVGYHSRSGLTLIFKSQDLQIGKMVFNCLFIFLCSIILFISLSWFFSHPIEHLGQFVLVVATASIGICAILNFVALLTASVSQSFVLFSLLALPLTIPFILTGVKLSAYAAGLIQGSTFAEEYLILCALSLLSLGVTLFLTPIIWRS